MRATRHPIAIGRPVEPREFAEFDACLVDAGYPAIPAPARTPEEMARLADEFPTPTDHDRHTRVFERMLALLLTANIPDAEAKRVATETAFDTTREYWLERADALTATTAK